MRTPPNAQYVEPSTGRVFRWETAFSELLRGVKEHRSEKGIAMPDGWELEVEHQVAMTLKVENVDDWVEDTEKPYVPHLVAYGRQMWKELHERAEAYPEIPQVPEREAEYQWLLSWVARIPSAKCDCAYKWHKMGLDFDLSCREGYVRSAIEVHNKVNATIGKPHWYPANTNACLGSSPSLDGR